MTNHEGVTLLRRDGAQFTSADEMAEEIGRLRDKLENIVIAYGMGWDLEGVIAAATEVLPDRQQDRAPGASPAITPEPNELLVGDTAYTITQVYREGARAAREGRTFHGHGYANGSQPAHDFEYAHDNEHAGLHVSVDGVDVIEARDASATFVAPDDHPEP